MKTKRFNPIALMALFMVALGLSACDSPLGANVTDGNTYILGGNAYTFSDPGTDAKIDSLLAIGRRNEEHIASLEAELAAVRDSVAANGATLRSLVESQAVMAAQLDSAAADRRAIHDQLVEISANLEDPEERKRINELIEENHARLIEIEAKLDQLIDDSAKRYSELIARDDSSAFALQTLRYLVSDDVALAQQLIANLDKLAQAFEASKVDEAIWRQTLAEQLDAIGANVAATRMAVLEFSTTFIDAIAELNAAAEALQTSSDNVEAAAELIKARADRLDAAADRIENLIKKQGDVHEDVHEAQAAIEQNRQKLAKVLELLWQLISG